MSVTNITINEKYPPILLTGYEKVLLFILRIVSIAATLFVMYNTPILPGASFFYLIPLSFTIRIFLFGDIFGYHKGCYGLKTFYIVMLFRYIIYPIYTCISGYFNTDNPLVEWGNTYGIFMISLECFVVCITIKQTYLPIYYKEYNKINSNKIINSSLTKSGLCFVLFSVACIIFKGGALSTMRFLVVTEKYNEVDAWLSYDTWIAQTLMAFLVIVIVSYYHNKEKHHHSFFNIILPLVVALASTTIVFTNNRMTMIYYAVSALAILNYAFPKYKKMFKASLLCALAVVIVSFTLLKQFNINANDRAGESLDTYQISAGMSDYLCGMENISFTCKMYDLNGQNVNIETFLAEVTKYCKVLNLPGLYIIPRHFEKTPTTIDYATIRGEMVSVAGQTLYYGGKYFGWLLDILVFVVICKLLLLFDIRSRLEQSLGRKYVFTWISILFGMSLCYCLTTLWLVITFIPTFLLGALWINDFFKPKNI